MKIKILIVICFAAVAYQVWAVTERFIDYIWYVYKFYGYGYPPAKFVSMHSVLLNIGVTIITLSCMILFIGNEVLWKRAILKLLCVIAGIVWLMIVMLYIGL